MNINDKPLSFNVNGKDVNSFSTIEEARKAAAGRAGSETIVETTETSLFEYKGKSTFTVHEANINPAEVKDGMKVNDLAKGINAVELIFDNNNDGTKTKDDIFSIKDNTLDLQKNVGNVYAFNTSELGKGTVRIVKNDDTTFAFALSIKDNPDIAGFDSVHNGVKDYLMGFIDTNTFADGDPQDEELLKAQLKHHLSLSVERAFVAGKFPEINVAVNKNENGEHHMSVTTDFPIVGLTEKDLNKLNVTTDKDGKTSIPFGKVKVTTDLQTSDKPSLAFELLTKSYKPIDIPLRPVGNQYFAEEKAIDNNTEKAFVKLSTDQTVEVSSGVTWLGGNDPALTVSAAYKKDFKDYAAVKLNYGAQVDVLPTNGQFQVTPTLGANVTALKYYGVPLSVNLDVGPSLGNMTTGKDFSFGVKTGVGLKVNVTNNIDLGVNYSHVFGIKGESQNSVGASLGIKF